MPKGIIPRVNEAREFLEIAKDFKDPKEIIREALSNSWDAGASEVSIKFDLARISGTQRKKSWLRLTTMVKEWAANLVMELSPVKLRGFSIWEIPTNLTDLLGLKDMVRKSIIKATVSGRRHGNLENVLWLKQK